MQVQMRLVRAMGNSFNRILKDYFWKFDFQFVEVFWIERELTNWFWGISKRCETLVFHHIFNWEIQIQNPKQQWKRRCDSLVCQKFFEIIYWKVYLRSTKEHYMKNDTERIQIRGSFRSLQKAFNEGFTINRQLSDRNCFQPSSCVDR